VQGRADARIGHLNRDEINAIGCNIDGIIRHVTHHGYDRNDSTPNAHGNSNDLGSKTTA
jgi:hypothetical protein